MPSPTTFALFAAAALARIVVPGPAVTYVVSQSIDKGRRAGIVSALGVAGGGLCHVTAATAVLSALVLACLFVALAAASDSAYAVAAAALAYRFRGSAAARRIKRFVSGGIFIALGVTTAAARRT